MELMSTEPTVATPPSSPAPAAPSPSPAAPIAATPPASPASTPTPTTSTPTAASPAPTRPDWLPENFFDAAKGPKWDDFGKFFAEVATRDAANEVRRLS